jgi:hypothetical protein
MKVVLALHRRIFFLALIILLPLVSLAQTVEFPEPGRVVADFNNPTNRAAALVMMMNYLYHNGYERDHNLPITAKYMAALDEIDPPAAPNHFVFTKIYHAISDQPKFQLEIIQRYVPALAARVSQEFREKNRVNQSRVLTQKLRLAAALVILVIITVPLLFLLWPWRGRQREPQIPDAVAGALRFPDELRRVTVFRKEYSLLFECGQIFEKNAWTETNVTTTKTSGRNYTVGNTTYVEQPTTSTHISTEDYHRYWLNTPDGRKVSNQFSDNVFVANRGNVISVLMCGTDILIAYNHTTNNFVRLDSGLKAAHRFPGRWLWGATVLAVGVLVYSLKGYLATDYEREMPGGLNASLVRAMIMAAILSPIYIGILKWTVQTIRNFQFKRKYESGIRKFLEQCTPVLVEKFPRLPELPEVKPA